MASHCSCRQVPCITSSGSDGHSLSKSTPSDVEPAKPWSACFRAAAADTTWWDEQVLSRRPCPPRAANRGHQKQRRASASDKDLRWRKLVGPNEGSRARDERGSSVDRECEQICCCWNSTQGHCADEASPNTLPCRARTRVRNAAVKSRSRG